MLRIANELKVCSTCSRLSVGAVITDTNFRILSTGYNGNPPGFAHCKETNPDGDKSKCHCIHAEHQAGIYCPFSYDEKIAFVTAFPCTECLKILAAMNVKEVYFIDPYRYFDVSKTIADELNIKYSQINIED